MWKTGTAWKIRQIEAKALKKLRNNRNTLPFAEYVDDPEQALKNIERYRQDYYRFGKVYSEGSKKIKTAKTNQRVSFKDFDVDLSTLESGEVVRGVLPAKPKKKKEEKKLGAKILVPVIKRNEEETMRQREFHKKVKTDNIYTYFQTKGYTVEQIDQVLSELDDVKKALLVKRYGSDFKNPVLRELTPEEQNLFNKLLNPYLLNHLRKLNGEIKVKFSRKANTPNATDNIYSYYQAKGFSVEQIDQVLADLDETKKALLVKKYGPDFKNPVLGELTREEKGDFSRILNPYLLNHLRKLNGEVKVKASRKPSTGRKIITNIYTHLNEQGFSNEEIDIAISSLTPLFRGTLEKRFGSDLKNPVLNKLEEADYVRFYLVISKMKKTMMKNREDNAVLQLKEEVVETPVAEEIVETPVVEEVVVKEEETVEEVIEPVIAERQVLLFTVEPKKESITKEELKSILSIFNTPDFIEAAKTYEPTTYLILTLKLGYVNGKTYSSEAIADMLDIEVEDVNAIYKEGLNKLKAELINMIDEAIEKDINQTTRKLK